ncbi:MAG: SH3 domain-containing protein [Chloroflexi bacterium]|nr:SH3 domain-containing protein [Chloroflexota bacterium]
MRHSGPPSWFVILLGIAIVFGVYYLWLGIQTFMATGVTVVESTQQAVVGSTSTALRIHEIASNAPTLLPSFTPVPPCQDFEVSVREAIVRAQPDTSSRIEAALPLGTVVCVIAAVPGAEWYLIDDNRLTRRLEKVYMHQDIIRALNPTAIPTRTNTPAPTRTPTQTRTPAPTATSLPATRTQPPPPPSAAPNPAPASVSL